MDTLHAVLYGIVEGITEFLPISSTGHLMLLTELLGGDHSQFIKSFEIIIQLGAILSIIVLYPKRLLTERATQVRILAAFIPTALLGLLFYKLIKTYLLASISLVLCTLVLGGVLIIILERYLKLHPTTQHTKLSELPIGKSVLLGVLQCIAFIPGVSRSATTMFGGMFLGLSRKDAVEFSFFLAVPTMGAATALDILKNYHSFSADNLDFLAVGFVASFVTALLVVQWLSRFVATHDFIWFGVYRIALAVFGYYVFFF
jgi:undecaprenyl-diphosphatase